MKSIELLGVLGSEGEANIESINRLSLEKGIRQLSPKEEADHARLYISSKKQRDTSLNISSTFPFILFGIAEHAC